MQSPSPVRVVSRRAVKPPPRPRERIPLTTWDLSLLSADYIQKGLLFAPPPFSTAHLVDHLQAALGDALAAYYPVAGRLATDQHRDDAGRVVGCSVSVDCAGQDVEILEAVAAGVAIADVLPPDADVPRLVRSFFPLDDAINFDGHERPLFVVQVTELADGIFVGFVYNHALSDGTAFWDFISAWAEAARARLGAPRALLPRAAPLFERWSADGGAAAPVVLPYADLSGLIARPTLPPPPQRERMLHFSAESLAALKERARQELLAAGDAAGAAAVTRFQALSSLLWRCFVRSRRTAPDQEVVFRASANNRARLRPPLPTEYFGNAIGAVSTEAVRASELLARGHGWAAAAVGRAVAAHGDAGIRARAAAWEAEPGLSAFRLFDPNGMFVSSSPRFDMYGCDFGWGKALAARSGKANKYDGKVSLFPGREGGGGIDAEVVLAPEHMAALELDEEFWAAVSPDVWPARKD
ncbi:uncharacterized acetyltransferase At3g50280-like [Panicum virgatum]|uniref:Acetyltransferase n=1 Tax=Panicum virgatum TaxID=38727 RepID=A0A8T0MTR1_PANVG|nr:uncharacterized acetyltransferase At3g50280-like [Panicum virgatum]KAG2538156.1 hypothetical protein PVAP13_9NG382173 [Panicum virgatum]